MSPGRSGPAPCTLELGTAGHCQHLPGPPRAATTSLRIARHRPLLPVHRAVSPRPSQPCPLPPCFVLHACSLPASRCAVLPAPIWCCPVLPGPSCTELPAAVLPCPAPLIRHRPARPCRCFTPRCLASACTWLCCQVLRSLTWNCLALCCQAPSCAVPCRLSESHIALCCLLLRFIPLPTLLSPCCPPGCCLIGGGLYCRAPYCIMLSSGFALHHPALPDLELHSSASCCPACLLALLAWGCPGLPAADLPYAIPPGLCAPPEPAAAWCWGDKSCLGGGGTGRWGDAQVRQRWVWGGFMRGTRAGVAVPRVGSTDRW